MMIIILIIRDDGVDEDGGGGGGYDGRGDGDDKLTEQQLGCLRRERNNLDSWTI